MTLMRRLTLRITVALVSGMTAYSVNAQTYQPGAQSLGVQIRNASPIHKVGCSAKDEHCPAGQSWICGHFSQQCFCYPCPKKH